MNDKQDRKGAREEKTAGPGFQHEQSAQQVDEIRARADKEKLAQEEPNELGQQPMKTDPARRLSPQEQREKKRD